MGWCHEFGPDINADCGHPMVADTKSCKCTTCGVVCTGRFSGCAAVWAAGPRKVNAVRGVTQRRTTPTAATAEVAPADEADAGQPPLIGEEAATLVDALRAELLTVVRRLDDVQVDSLRTDLASVMHQLEKLTSAVVTQHQELQKLAADRAAPSAPPVQQRMVEQPPPTPPSADRGSQQPAKQPQAKQQQAKQPQAKQPQADRRPQQPPRQARPEQTRPNGGSPAPARATPPAPSVAPAPPSPVAPAPGEPEQVDLAVPLDHALLRPARPGEQSHR